MHWAVHVEGGLRRVKQAAVAVGKLIYSFGGYCCPGDYYYSVRGPIDIHVLNPVSYRWELIAPTKPPTPSPPIETQARAGEGPAEPEPDTVVPFQRYGHTVVAYGNHVYLWGGRNHLNACNVLYRYDTNSNKWEKPEVSGTCPGARSGHTAVVIRNQMFIFGGYETDVGLFSRDVYSLNLNTLIWSFISATGTAPAFLYSHSATVYLDRFLIIFGRSGDALGPVPTRSELYSNTVVCLDVERQEWFRPRTSGTPPSPRRSHSAYMNNGYMYVFGGYYGSNETHLKDFFRYDPESGNWQSLVPCGNGPPPRIGPGCVVLDNRVFFFGGTSLDGEVNHDDLYVLDMDPSLRTLCQLKIISDGLDQSGLPRALRKELQSMTTPTVLAASTTASGGIGVGTVLA